MRMETIMEQFSPRGSKKRGPEQQIVEDLIRYLKLKDWYIVILHGNIYVNGLPDLLCTHAKYGIRLIEVKNPGNYSFTRAQLDKFPLLCANGAGVWILTAATDSEYYKLFKPCNWWQFLDIWK